jgi:hypothetical protein
MSMSLILQLTNAPVLPPSTALGPVIAQATAATAAPSTPLFIGLRLNHGNFPLWHTLALTNISGASLRGFLDSTTTVPDQTITEGTGTDTHTVSNPEYVQWWTHDKKVLGLLLFSMMEEIVNQLISCSTAATVLSSIQAMLSAQNRGEVRHIWHQIQALKKRDMTVSEYMGKVKALADAMAAAGSPLHDDEVIDYMLTGLGRPYNPIAASLNIAPTVVSLSAFYSMVLNYEALQLSQQADDEDWSSSANSAVRSGQTSRPGAPDTGRSSGSYPSGGYPWQG